MSAEWITVIMFGSMLLLLVLGVPIAFGLGGICLVMAFWLWGPEALSMGYLGTRSVMSMFSLACGPMFVFIGILLTRSGVAEEMYRTLQMWLAPVPGSLAVATVVVSTVIAAMVGGITAATITMGYIALPIMLKFKYDKSIAIGCIQGGAALGFLIPPSLVAVIYALIAKESIGRLFAGGLFPGLLISGMFMIYILVRCWLQPHIGPILPKEERVSWLVKVRALVSLLPPLFVIMTMMGTIFLGIATPVESSAMGAAATLVVVALKRRLTWEVVKDALETSVSVGGMIIWIFMSAMAFSAVYDGLGARTVIEPLVFALPWGSWGVIGVMMVSWFFLGMFLDDYAILFITAPIYLPIMGTLGFDLVWFGVLYMLNMQMAYLTPPFGYCLYMIKAVCPPDITMMDIYKSTGPFVIIQAIGLALCIIFPEIVMWFPRVVFG